MNELTFIIEVRDWSQSAEPRAVDMVHIFSLRYTSYIA